MTILILWAAGNRMISAGVWGDLIAPTIQRIEGLCRPPTLLLSGSIESQDRSTPVIENCEPNFRKGSHCGSSAHSSRLRELTPSGRSRQISTARSKRLSCPCGIIGQPAYSQYHQSHECVKAKCRAAAGKNGQKRDENQCWPNDFFRSSREPRKEAKDASPTGSPLPALGPDAPPLRSKITTQASLQIPPNLVPPERRRPSGSPNIRVRLV